MAPPPPAHPAHSVTPSPNQRHFVSFTRKLNSKIFALVKHKNLFIMTREHRVNIQYFSAIGMLVCGVALSVAGFIVSPVGEIYDSVLWFAAQTMIYAGSVFGVSVYVNDKFRSITDKLNQQNGTKKDN